MDRVYNFAAGPAVLPLPVLEKAQKEMTDFAGTGMSVMEMSHRSKPFEEIMAGAESALRDLLSIPQNYKVLFLQGGASLQFAMVPLNIGSPGDYVISGYFAKKAFEEAAKLGTANVAASSQAEDFSRVPAVDPAGLNPGASYVHVTSNNTIYGTQMKRFPDAGAIPLVADMGSDFLSRPVDVSKFGLIYAGAQKNAGPAGLTVVIIREDLLSRPHGVIPTMLEYKVHADGRSMYNTPPTYSVYVAKLVFDWLIRQGGLSVMARRNEEKARALYDVLDGSEMFKGTAFQPDRSPMNVTFVLPTEDLTKKFLTQAQAAGFSGLKGHRAVGGVRASLYNAMPLDGARALASFMKEFEKAGENV